MKKLIGIAFLFFIAQWASLFSQDTLSLSDLKIESCSSPRTNCPHLYKGEKFEGLAIDREQYRRFLDHEKKYGNEIFPYALFDKIPSLALVDEKQMVSLHEFWQGTILNTRYYYPSIAKENLRYKINWQYGRTNRSSSGAWNDGGRDGAWLFWDGRGELLRKETYSNGKLNGDQILYVPGGDTLMWTIYRDGNKFSEYTKDNIRGGEYIQYKNDKKEGPLISWHPSGKLHSQSNYENGLMNGPIIWFNEQGEKKLSGSYVKGKKDGIWLARHPNGSLFYTGKFYQGLRHGNWTLFYPDGAKWTEGEFKNGQKNGLHTAWHPNGEVMQREFFEEGKLHGDRHQFHENGSLSLREGYQHGLREGKLSSWYPNGVSERICYFSEGLLDGKFTTWYKDGRMKVNGVYVEGYKEGVWMLLDPKQKDYEEIYRSGKLVEKRGEGSRTLIKED